MNCVNRIAPNTFLFKYSLQTGCKVIGIFMCVISIICALVFSAELLYYEGCDTCSQTIFHNVYSFSISVILYCTCVFFLNLWFMWGVKRQKPQVVLAWVVATTVWWIQGSCLLFIQLLLRLSDLGISWIAAFCFAFIAFVIFAYCLLIGYSYWLEIKSNRVTRDTTTEPIPVKN